MNTLRVDWKSCPAGIKTGLKEIVADRAGAFDGKGGLTVRFVEGGIEGRPGFVISKEKGGVLLRYSRGCDAFRAVGYLLGEMFFGREVGEVEQRSQFDLLGIKLDCARGGVPTVETLKKLFRRMALLGFNAFSPYLEDTYEIPGEPFFGYLRGRFSQKDLKAIDDYAFGLGIEVFGHVRSLGHAEQILQWPVYADLRDMPAVFLADHEPTYEFIEKMFRAATGALRSKRVFIGTDEAHGLGTGRYRRMKGMKPPFNIFNDHLKRVVEICKKLGLKPSSSGDMYFRLGSKTNWYYDEEAVIPQDIIDGIPKDLQVIYWDYYHEEPEFYERWIDKHRAMGKEPLLHGGVWTWSHFWAQLPFSFLVTEALMTACRRKGVRENFCTLWGDDGMQVDLESAMPGLAQYAELAYQEKAEGGALRRQFAGACGEDVFDAYVRASFIDVRDSEKDMLRIPDNPSTWLLWNDPLLGILDLQVSNKGLAEHHRKLALELKGLAKGGAMAKRLLFPAQIAKVLSLKVDLHGRLAAALKKKDKKALRALLTKVVEPVRKEVDKLWKIHREVWLGTYTPFGWENVEGRYGMLRNRLESLADRLKEYLAGETKSIPELESKLFKIFPKDDIYTMIKYPRCVTASAVR